MKPVLIVTLASAVVVSMIIARPSTTTSQPRAASASPTPLTIEQLIDIRHPSNPMWSPDGRHVVFVWDRAGVSKVYVADVPDAAQAAPAPRELAVKSRGEQMGVPHEVPGKIQHQHIEEGGAEQVTQPTVAHPKSRGTHPGEIGM